MAANQAILRAISENRIASFFDAGGAASFASPGRRAACSIANQAWGGAIGRRIKQPAVSGASGKSALRHG